MPDANVRRWGMGSPEPRTRAARGLTAGRLGRARFTKDDTATAVPNRIAILAALGGIRRLAGHGQPLAEFMPVKADRPYGRGRPVQADRP